MIPLKVTMSGWMRYREQTTADFSGARLISICGENGAGKSSIFDAITFALFGRQRLGTQHIEELISDGGDQCAVEFEFEQEGRRYRVRRTRGRRAAQGSQGLWAWDASVEDWVAVSNSQYARGLDKALAAVIRISPEAFTSSFMLQQGAATEFLDAKPAERFSVVSSLVNLEAYQTLEKRAREAQRSASLAVQQYNTKLQEYEGVDAESLALLRTRLAHAAEQRDAAMHERDRARVLREAAGEYARLMREIEYAQRQIEAAAELTTEAGQIEANAQRFSTLEGEIVAARQIREELEAAVGAELEAQSASARLAALDLTTSARVVEAAERRIAIAAVAVERLSAEHKAAVRDERAAAEFLGVAASILTLRRRLAEAESRAAAATKELERLPDLEAEATAVRAVAAALPLLQQLGRDRQAMERAAKENPREALSVLDGRTQDLIAERDAAAAMAESCVSAHERAQHEAAEARAEANALRKQVVQRGESIHEAVCSRCGQAIDPEQARLELEALTEHARVADARAKAAAQAAHEAKSAAEQASRRRSELDDAVRQAVVDRRGLLQRIEALDVATTTVRESYSRFVSMAPPSLREAVPERLPLSHLLEIYREQKHIAERAPDVESELRRLHGLQGLAQAAALQIEQMRADLSGAESRAGDRLEAIDDAEQAHAAAMQHLHGSEAALGAAREEERTAREEGDRAREELAAAKEEQRGLEIRRTSLEQAAEGRRRAARSIAVRLDPALRGRVLEDVRGVLDLLEREAERLADAPARLEQLAEARRQHSHFGGMLETLSKNLERIPPEHRVAEEEAQAALDRADVSVRETGAFWERCQHEVARMERDLEQVESLRGDLDRMETRSQRLKKLVDLLGKTGLQGALVSEALETVMSHANAFLERLTGGTLVLHLERGEGDALELRAQDVTCMREARSVQVLSGSQKFRCAVAIAAGIGQYAGAGGMRSIVIDEGFGSLDQQGQQLIIEELKNLAEHMDRVIVVSHLDAFTDRTHFPDQIRVLRDGERSRIERAS
jgi:exonuclease SbcC